MRGRPLWPPAVSRLAARPSQSNPRGSGLDRGTDAWARSRDRRKWSCGGGGLDYGNQSRGYFNGGRPPVMTTRCAPACSQALPVKPQGVSDRGIEAWAWSRDRRNLEFLRWGSSGPSSLMFGALQRNEIWPSCCFYVSSAEQQEGQIWIGLVLPHQG